MRKTLIIVTYWTNRVDHRLSHTYTMNYFIAPENLEETIGKIKDIVSTIREIARNKDKCKGQYMYNLLIQRNLDLELCANLLGSTMYIALADYWDCATEIYTASDIELMSSMNDVSEFIKYPSI